MAHTGMVYLQGCESSLLKNKCGRETVLQVLKVIKRHDRR